jgi:DNA-binding response OmpR family regulator
MLCAEGMQGTREMQAAAFVVGALDGPAIALTDLARRLDFSAVLPYGGLAAAEEQLDRTPLCFFLFAAVPDVSALRPIAETIRFSPSRRVRFSPLIYFADQLSVEAITRCMNMGFDDVVTQPFTRSQVAERIDRQIGQNLTYYETPGYFGPDRRDRVTAPKRAAESRTGGQFRRLEIVRHLVSGISVVRDDLYRLPGG